MLPYWSLYFTGRNQAFHFFFIEYLAHINVDLRKPLIMSIFQTSRGLLPKR
jgi:hypothetical protein